MVFLSIAQFARSRGPDEFWRKRRILKLAAHYVGRRRNCYSIAIRGVQRALQYVTKGRELKKLDMKELWTSRVNSACKQHNSNFRILHEGLTRCNILLNSKTLADLAAWEPRTFEAINKVAVARAVQDNYKHVRDRKYPTDVIKLTETIK